MIKKFIDWMIKKFIDSHSFNKCQTSATFFSDFKTTALVRRVCMSITYCNPPANGIDTLQPYNVVTKFYVERVIPPRPWSTKRVDTMGITMIDWYNVQLIVQMVRFSVGSLG